MTPLPRQVVALRNAAARARCASRPPRCPRPCPSGAPPTSPRSSPGHLDRRHFSCTAVYYSGALPADRPAPASVHVFDDRLEASSAPPHVVSHAAPSQARRGARPCTASTIATSSTPCAVSRQRWPDRSTATASSPEAITLQPGRRCPRALPGGTPAVRGRAASPRSSFSDVEVDFSKTWGDKADTELPPISVMPILASSSKKVELDREARRRQHASGVAPDDRPEHGAGPASGGQPRDHAARGAARITIDKVGSQKPDDAKRFSLATTTTGIERRGTTMESFATAEFNLDETEKLKANDFEKEEAGVELSVTGTNPTSFVVSASRATRLSSSTRRSRSSDRARDAPERDVHAFLGGNAVARASMSVRSKSRLHLLDEKITVTPNAYVVQPRRQHAGGAEVVFLSRARAEQYMADQQLEPDLPRPRPRARGHELRQAA